MHYAFLSYNALIHIVSPVLLILVNLAAVAMSIPIARWGIAFSVIVIIINLYCLMLQRYNALRLRRYQTRLRKSRAGKNRKNADCLARCFPADYPDQYIKKDLEYLAEMKAALGSGADFVIREEDSEILERLAAWKQTADSPVRAGNSDNRKAGEKKSLPVKPQDSAGKTKQKTKQRSQEQETQTTALYTKAQMRTAWLQSHFRKGQGTMLSTCCVLTEGRRSEKAFESLFPDAAKETILDGISAFLLAAENNHVKTDAFTETQQ